MARDYSNKNLQNASFENEDLSYANFSNSDLRGADFTGANLKSAQFTGARTGITPLNVILIFIAALIVSLFSGYLAMLAGQTIREMLASEDQKIRGSGIATIVIIVLFIVYAMWKGTGRAIKHLIVPVVLPAAVLGLFYYVTRMGTGLGMLKLVIALFFAVFMFVVGTIARATADTLSIILFIIVALSGGMFGKTIGGGVSSVIMALACAQVSKRAIGDAKGFETLRKIAFYVTKKLGTSFRNTCLAQANFSQSKIHNADFSGADLSSVNWSDVKTVNSVTGEKIFSVEQPARAEDSPAN